jgi:hypothetical protein
MLEIYIYTACSRMLPYIFLFIHASFSFFNWNSGGWSQIWSTRHCATSRPVVPAPGDYECNDFQGKPKYSEITCPSAALSTRDPTCCPDANPGHRGGKSATDRLTYGTAIYKYIQLVGLLRRVISLSQGRYLQTGQHEHRINADNADIYALSGIRTHDPSI